MTTIPNWLANRAYLTPNRVAIKSEEITLTFKELHQRVVRTAKQLSYIGINKGDTVAVLLMNSVEMIQIIHGLNYIGVTTVLLNARLTKHEVLWQNEDSGAKLIISEEKLVKQLGLHRDAIMIEELLDSPEQEVDIQAEFLLEMTNTIMYTSGTTGKPKGVLQTYGNHWWSAIGSALNLGLKEEDCWLVVVPFFHISGLSILIRSVVYGIPIVLQKGFSPKVANDAIMNQGVTIVSVVSTMLTKMLNELGGESYPPSFRCMLLGGGPAPMPLLEKCQQLNVPVYQSYGMTETASQIVTLAPEYSLGKIGSAGKPLFPCQLRIEKNGGIVKPFEHGEIVVKGPNVTKGYLHREVATKNAIKNDWFYTGDLGYVDNDGFLYVLDRRSDLIISGGENIYPAEIEAILLSHAFVNEAGVIGVPDTQWGQVPVAFVTMKDEQTVDKEELIAFCAERLGRYKIPKDIYFLDRLPRNATNKLLRRNLLQLISPKE